MKWLIFASDVQAGMADQLLARLLARYLEHRGYEINEGGYARGKLVSSGASSGAAIQTWCAPRVTVLGQYAVLSPNEKPQAAAMLTDTPMTLATGWAALVPGLNVEAIDWAAVAVACGLNPLTFDPTVEITLSGVNWVRGAFAILGLAYVEVTDPDFPE